MAHAVKASTQKVEADRPVELRPAWSTEFRTARVTHRETLSGKAKTTNSNKTKLTG